MSEWDAIKEWNRFLDEDDDEEDDDDSEQDSSVCVKKKEPIDVLDLPEERFVRIECLSEYDLYVSVEDWGSAF